MSGGGGEGDGGRHGNDSFDGGFECLAWTAASGGWAVEGGVMPSRQTQEQQR